MATQLAERATNPVDVFRQTLSQPAFREQIKMALPNHISPEKFERVALTAVQQTPALLDPQKVDRRSLFGALVKAAQDGLLPDGREGAIVPYKGKAMWQPMVAGIMTKVRRSGEIANWEVAAVYEKDQFERLLGDDQRIYHKPYEEGDPGQVVGAYSIVTFKDGTKSRDYMPRWRIEKARAQGTARDSLMWSQFYDEGAIKTVIKHHAKRLPMSTDVEAIINRDDFMQHETAPAAPQKLEAEQQPMTRLQAIEASIPDDDPPVEPEVITEQAEELEAEIEQPEAAAQITLADQLSLDAHPGTAKADAIIAEIDEADAKLDINAIIGRSADDIAAMLKADQDRIDAAASARVKAIDASRAKEGANG